MTEQMGGDRRQMSDEEREVLRLIVGRLATLPEEERNRQIAQIFEVAAMRSEDWAIVRDIPRSRLVALGAFSLLAFFGSVVAALFEFVGWDGIKSLFAHAQH